MDDGHFYFLHDNYFIDFPDPKLKKNKETINGEFHNRPCFCAFAADSNQIFWLIPFSSKTEKFKAIYQRKIARYGKCDTILFGKVLGYEKAFLIQNMCPITTKYIINEYFDSVAHIPVRLDGAFEKELIHKAKTVSPLIRQGQNLVFPDILKIESELL